MNSHEPVKRHVAARSSMRTGRARRIRGKLARFAAISLTGGAVFASCETRVKDAVVEGLRSVVLDPSVSQNIVEAIVDGSTSTSTTTDQ